MNDAMSQTMSKQLRHHVMKCRAISECREINEKPGGPNDMSFGPRYVFFLLTYIYIYLFKCQQVQGPTLTTRVSWWAASTFSDPTIAPNASWWGYYLLLETPRPTLAANELVGRFHTTHPQTPPSLQRRVGGGFIFIILYI
jgi:hypothetical protein